MNRKSSVLILTIFLLVILLILGTALIARSVSENNMSKRNLDSTHAFWAAEAGLSRALKELRVSYNQCGAGVLSGNLNSVDAGYLVDIKCGGQDRIITSTGFVPAIGTASVQRITEGVIKKSIPLGFYDKAIYSAGDVDLNGDRYTIDGDVVYAGDIDNTGNITGTVTQDSTISPLALLDFSQLLAVSQAQGNYYDAARIGSGDPFPGSFWYTTPTDPLDPTTGVPNVVYITEDLTLNGSVGTIGGFFVVVGDVITNPNDIQDATINGSGQIEGAIYTRGTFRVNGGAGNLNVNGGVWAGEEARLNGNAHVAYNDFYMSSIEGLSIDASAQITSWKEQSNPYQLTP